MKTIILFNLLFTIMLYSEELTNSTQINISKTWPQEPFGWIYPIDINVPNIDYSENGLPLCILIHGFGGNGENVLLQWEGLLQNHILIAPTGYMNCWNISDEPSEAPDVEMIGDLIELLQTYDNVNSNKIRIIGSSNGSALSNRIFIENTNPGVDIICTIVSQLSEAQYHYDNFYYPSGDTGGSQEFDGYNTITIPIDGRKYLNIGNTNDQMIPYEGGPAVGVNFINSQYAIFIIAKSQGYQGNQLSEEGDQIGSSSVYEYSYLSNQVVHLRGNAGHGINVIQREYIIDFLQSQGDQGSSVDIDNLSDWNLVGLPLEVADNHYLTIFPDAIENTLFSFNDVYTSYSLIIEGDGYWLRFDSAGNTTITGNIINELTINLIEGWNLISGLSIPLDITDIQDSDGIVISGTIYGYDVLYYESEFLNPGEGFWIRANNDGAITLVSSGQNNFNSGS